MTRVSAVVNTLPISVCMISGAEAHRINRALESVAGWASEVIVVLNAEVTDGTEEIARGCGAKVFREPWRGFAAQKNSAAAKATQPWLLGLDADEIVTLELREEMGRVVAQIEAANAAYEFPRCSNYCGRWIRHGDWYPDRQTRLWRRGRAAWAGKGLHEKLRVEGPVGRLRGELLHFSMESVDHHVQKTLHYANEFAAQCRAGRRRVGLFDLVFRPPWSFVRGFILKLGFLDGWVGFSIAWMTAFYTFLRYFKALEAQSAGRS